MLTSSLKSINKNVGHSKVLTRSYDYLKKISRDVYEIVTHLVKNILWNIHELCLVGVVEWIIRLGESSGHVVRTRFFTVSHGGRISPKSSGMRSRETGSRSGRSSASEVSASRSRASRWSLRVAGGGCVQPAKNQRSESLRVIGWIW